MFKVFAQTNLGPIQGEGLGPFARTAPTTSGTVALTRFTNIVSSIIGIMTVAAGIWFVLQFMIGAFYWITSTGDKAKLEQARDRILNAFVGLVITTAGWAILALAGQFLGFDILIEDPAAIIRALGF